MWDCEKENAQWLKTYQTCFKMSSALAEQDICPSIYYPNSMQFITIMITVYEHRFSIVLIKLSKGNIYALSCKEYNM